MKQYAYTIAFSTNDLYMACHSACQKIGMAPLPYFLAKKHPELVPVDLINRVTLVTQDSKLLTRPSDLSSETRYTILDTSIPLTQDYPLYLVMHPDVRRSARVRAVADWLIASTAQLS